MDIQIILAEMNSTLKEISNYLGKNDSNIFTGAMTLIGVLVGSILTYVLQFAGTLNVRISHVDYKKRLMVPNGFGGKVDNPYDDGDKSRTEYDRIEVSFNLELFNTSVNSVNLNSLKLYQRKENISTRIKYNNIDQERHINLNSDFLQEDIPPRIFRCIELRFVVDNKKISEENLEIYYRVNHKEKRLRIEL